MEENMLFTPLDCQKIGYDFSIAGKVVILCASSLPENDRSAENQLYFCTGGFGSKPNPSGRACCRVSGKWGANTLEPQRYGWHRAFALR